MGNLCTCSIRNGVAQRRRQSPASSKQQTSLHLKGLSSRSYSPFETPFSCYPDMLYDLILVAYDTIP